jgi:hypothetical protein
MGQDSVGNWDLFEASSARRNPASVCGVYYCVIIKKWFFFFHSAEVGE